MNENEPPDDRYPTEYEPNPLIGERWRDEFREEVAQARRELGLPAVAEPPPGYAFLPEEMVCADCGLNPLAHSLYNGMCPVVPFERTGVNLFEPTSGLGGEYDAYEPNDPKGWTL